MTPGSPQSPWHVAVAGSDLHGIADRGGTGRQFVPSTIRESNEKSVTSVFTDTATVRAAALFTRLYREERPYVERALQRLGVAKRDISDLAQDLFVIVLRRLPVYDQSRPPRPWLFGIAFRIVCDYRRSSRVVREVLGKLPEVADQGPAADDQVAARQAQSRLMKMLDRLAPTRRSVFVLHDVDSMPGAEIAILLGIPLATVYSRLLRARKDVAAAMKRICAADADGRHNELARQSPPARRHDFVCGRGV